MSDLVSVGLELLDRQIIDRDGRPVGKVDDLELERREDGSLEVTALLVGPMALGPRIGGRLGTWVVAVARRLRPRDDGAPVRVPAAAVRRVGPEIDLDVSVDDLGAARLETWLREKVVDPIPGARHETG